jgi:restriction system protein
VNRLLFDQGLPRSTGALLPQAGWDVVHVSDIGMSRADDVDILFRKRSFVGQLIAASRINGLAIQKACPESTCAGRHLAQKARWGRFTITARGRRVLDSNPAKLDNDFLNQFEEFRQFKEKSVDITTQNELSVEPSPASQTATPDEIMRVAHSQIEASLAQELLDRIRAAPPAFFERLIVSLLLNMGYGGSVADAGRALGRSGDDGVGGVTDQDTLGLDRVYVQAKRYASGNNIGPGAIRDFFWKSGSSQSCKGLICDDLGPLLFCEGDRRVPQQADRLD